MYVRLDKAKGGSRYDSIGLVKVARYSRPATAKVRNREVLK